ncbi:putative phage protein (TIGR02218 family) [Albidovulum inexpectatum]|uniref:Putative phage protein (TIGR02218 family) n=1 Tax=Albidovulum inexpectatum TaxID=196587 RepID=A0A2S5JE71_9RHOB|nr:DUF2163 domain-containing protein [Albidovulum inexpectatum]PPB79753.1 putative phage protein (TIGR02218 family) [Albidovulum inexpectatum]
MKALDPALQAHLDDGTTTLAWCWRITRSDGQVFGFTDHDRTLSFDGTSFEPESGFTASELRGGADLAVDAQDAQGVLSSDRITETDILDGRWDNAAVEVWRVNWADTSQRALLRRGNIGQIRRGRVAFVAEMRSLAHVLNQTVGRTFQYGCDATLGDARCGVDLDDPAYRLDQYTYGVTARIDDRVFRCEAPLGYVDKANSGLYDLGTIEWTTGPNAGRRAEILRVRAFQVAFYAVVDVTLAEAPVRPIANGHLFILRAGCDKRLETCAARFNNALNFRGFPHIPGQDTVLRFGKQSGSNTGEVL